MVISRDAIQKLLPLFRPLMDNENQRRGYLIRALGVDVPVLHRLVWNEPVDAFITHTIKELVAFGEITSGQPALCALLEVIREDVGTDVQAQIDDLLKQIATELKQPQDRQNWSSVTTLRGHSETVQTVAIGLEGKLLASGSLDRTIKLWNLETGEVLHTLTGHSSHVLSLAFSPDGQTLASASNLEVANSNIKLWDVSTGALRSILDGGLLNLRVSCVAFSPDGQYLASGNIDATIKLWHLGSGKLRQTLRGHGWDVRAISFSSDGQLLVSSGLDSAIKIWNWRTGELLHTLNRPSPSDFIASLVSWFDH